MAAFSEGAAKVIKAELQHLQSSQDPTIWSMLSSLPDQISGAQKGDTYAVPSISALTAYSDGSTDQTVLSATLAELLLVIDREPFLPIEITRRREAQLLGGGRWGEQLAIEAMQAIVNYREADVCDYMLSLAYDSSATYWVNPGATTLTRNFLLQAKAYLAGQRGATGNYALICDSYAEAGLRSLVGFTATQLTSDSASAGRVGFRRIGEFDGIPVAITNDNPGSLARGQRTVASTAYANVSNVQTVTVAAGHGIVPGNFVTFNTVTAGGDVATATVVTSVTATTVVFANAGGNSNATEAGTITVRGAVNFLADMGHIWKGESDEMMVRLVPPTGRTGSVLQVSPLYGRIGRPGRVVAIGSPYAALTQS